MKYINEGKVIIKSPNDFRYGTTANNWKKEVLEKVNVRGSKYTLDLSEVIYMDSGTFRIVFDLLSKFETVIPPKSERVVELYNLWLDSKKELSK